MFDGAVVGAVDRHGDAVGAGRGHGQVAGEVCLLHHDDGVHLKVKNI